MARDAHFLQDAIRSEQGPVVLVIAQRNTVLASEVELAVTSESRRRGLLGRDALAAGSALIIAPSGGIHTFRMRFPIDVIFVARDGRVMKIRSAVPPSRISLSLRAFAVVETAAGAAHAAGLRVGDQLELRRA